MNGPHMTLFGRLTRDPEMKYTPNDGIPYVTVGVAVNTYHGPDQDQETLFVNATFWRHHAETVASRSRRGQMVFIQGRYSCREYTRHDGATALSHDVSVKEFRNLPQPTAADDQDPIPGDAPDQIPDNVAPAA